ncbi:hypothetical protein FOZ61_001889 [Perkinsus olseni]|uniref:Uncharacterized protein n=1 Tax=Perkinsus olseni TaxID=32597 RepID=A0A7J6MFX2_PEROL|nr:hypothetical protein FOZ61_001889 [Perkinsus olseni]KAF4675783.1 hypothetical protein FOL46_000110 [Perkinsus olseni]
MKLGRNVVAALNEEVTEQRLSLAVDCLEGFAAAMPTDAANDLGTLFALTMNNMAQLRKEEGELAKAKGYLQAVVETINFDKNEEMARLHVATYMNLSELCSSTGDIREAVLNARRAVEVSENFIGNGDSLAIIHAIACNNYAVQLAAEGVNLEDAESFCRKALCVVEGSLGEQNDELRRVFTESLERIEASQSERMRARGLESDVSDDASPVANTIVEDEAASAHMLENSPQGPSELHRQSKVANEIHFDLGRSEPSELESSPVSAREVALGEPAIDEPGFTLEDSKVHRSEISVMVALRSESGPESQATVSKEDLNEGRANGESEVSPEVSQFDSEPSVEQSAEPVETVQNVPVAVPSVGSISEPNATPTEHILRRELSTSDTPLLLLPQLRSHDDRRSKWTEPDSGIKFFAEKMANPELDGLRDLGSPKWTVRYDLVDESYVVADNEGTEWVVKSGEQKEARPWKLLD